MDYEETSIPIAFDNVPAEIESLGGGRKVTIDDLRRALWRLSQALSDAAAEASCFTRIPSAGEGALFAASADLINYLAGVRKSLAETLPAALEKLEAALPAGGGVDRTDINHKEGSHNA